jgi:hypothetical protein
MACMLLIQKEKSSLCWQIDVFIGSEGGYRPSAVTRSAVEVYHGCPEVVTRAAGPQPKRYAP